MAWSNRREREAEAARQAELHRQRAAGAKAIAKAGERRSIRGDLAPRRVWNRGGLGKRWNRPFGRALQAMDSVAAALVTVENAEQPGRAFADASTHLRGTAISVDRALGRCEDIVRAATKLEATLQSVSADRPDDRGRLTARLQEAEDGLVQHVDAMESAAIAANELALQSTLRGGDERAVMDIDARLRSVSTLLDSEGRP